jgi:hypothetical protein
MIDAMSMKDIIYENNFTGWNEWKNELFNLNY